MSKPIDPKRTKPVQRSPRPDPSPAPKVRQRPRPFSREDIADLLTPPGGYMEWDAVIDKPDRD